MPSTNAKHFALGAVVVAIFAAMFCRGVPPRGATDPINLEMERLVLRRTVVPVLAVSSGSDGADPALVQAVFAARTADLSLGEDVAHPDLPALDQAYRPLTWTNGESMPVIQETKLPHSSGRHQIVDGDTLQRISRRHYGRPDFAELIFEANRDVLDHPDLLPLGVTIEVPPLSRLGSGSFALPMESHPPS